ncbi:hypothetical protein BDF19DRAFT_36105 [Syncephalis fuscata]|nr:hypothetical protein BDF19DRAFT_36105 [Syncephalis fuscata]
MALTMNHSFIIHTNTHTHTRCVFFINTFLFFFHLIDSTSLLFLLWSVIQPVDFIPMSRTSHSSISFGGDDDADTYVRSTGGAGGAHASGGGKSSISFGRTEGPVSAGQPPSSRGSTRHNVGGNTSISFSEHEGGEDAHSAWRPSVNGSRSGGTGGKSSISFGSGDIDSDDEEEKEKRKKAAMVQRKYMPPSGGTGGKSSIDFNADNDDDDGSVVTTRPVHPMSKSKLKFGDESDSDSELNQKGSVSSVRILETHSSTGGRSQLTLSNDPDDHDPGATELTSRVLDPSHATHVSMLTNEGETPSDVTGITRGDSNGRYNNHSTLEFNGHAVVDSSSTGGKSQIAFGDDGDHDVDTATKGVNKLSMTDKHSTFNGDKQQRITHASKSSLVFCDDRTSVGLEVDKDDDLAKPRPANASVAGRGGMRNPNLGELSKEYYEEDHRSNGSRGNIRDPNTTNEEKTRAPVFKPQQAPGGTSSISFY